MKIAAFYSDNPFAGWVQCEGFVEVLRRMGNEVVAIPVPSRVFGTVHGGKITQELANKINKPINDCDLIIVSGPEWLRKWIKMFYPDWAKLKMPKVGWYHESFVREDYTLNYADYERMFDFHFFPDRADAEKYKGEFLPLGVDYEMFNPLPEVERDIEVGFIGLMYAKRAKFVEELTPHLGDIQIQYRAAFNSDQGLIPAIGVWNFEGFNVRLSMHLLAETYRRIKVFVTFPSMSNVVVAKVLEALACGCILVAPKQPVTLPGCFEYQGAYQCAERIRAAMKGTQYTDTVKRLYEYHRMELRFEQIFRRVGCPTSSSQAAAASSATT